MRNKLNRKKNHIICFILNITAWKCMYLDHVHDKMKKCDVGSDDLQ